MLYAGIDIHKHVFHAVVLDPVTGELCECRFQRSRERLSEWASEWEGKLAGVAIEATTGWRWVTRELQAHGIEVHLLDAGRASALRGRRRKAKTDKLDAKWLAMILARDLLSECEAWIPPAEIQQLRDQTRLRKSLVESRTDWAQRLHALLTHEGWPCSRGRLLTREGRRWVTALDLDPAARVHVEVMIKVIEGFDEQIGIVERDLRRFSRRDSRCQALQTIFGVGAILSCHLLAEIGEATRFKRSRQLVRASGLDPTQSDGGVLINKINAIANPTSSTRYTYSSATLAGALALQQNDFLALKAVESYAKASGDINVTFGYLGLKFAVYLAAPGESPQRWLAVVGETYNQGALDYSLICPDTSGGAGVTSGATY